MSEKSKNFRKKELKLPKKESKSGKSLKVSANFRKIGPNTAPKALKSPENN